MKNLLILVTTLALAACGGGGGSSGGGGVAYVPPGITATPTPAAPQFKASGKAQAFLSGDAKHGVMTLDKARHATDAVRFAMAATPTPFPSPTALPTPAGNPLIPTRVSIGSGFNATIGTYLIIQVTDGLGHALHEASAPTLQTNYPSVIGLAAPSTANSAQFPNAWQSSFSFLSGHIPPTHAQVASTFPDSVGVLDAYVYDAFFLSCSAGVQGIDTSGGVGGVSNTPSADIQMGNCDQLSPNGKNADLNFPYGFMLAAPSQADSFGQYLPAFNNLTTVPTFSSLGTNVSAGALSGLVGYIIVFKDKSGGFHKLMLSQVNINCPQSGCYVDGVTAIHLAATGKTFGF